MLHLSKTLVAHYTSLGLRGIYQDFPPFRFLDPFCPGYLDRKGKISSEVKPTDRPIPSPTQPPSLTKLVESQGEMMKVGSLSEAYIATNCSGNEAIVPRPMKTEGGTHRLIYTTTPKPVSNAGETVFWEDIQLQSPCCNDI